VKKPQEDGEPMEQPVDSLADWAKKELQFDEEDLIANRQGKYSEKQRTRAARGGTALFLFALAAIIFVFFVLLTVDPIFGRPIDWVDIIPRGILVSGMMGVFAYMGWRSRRAAKSGVIHAFTGKVTFKKEKKETILCCGEKLNLPIDDKVRQSFLPDREYTFYCSDMDKTVLSMEI
jgi:hypothetical protein